MIIENINITETKWNQTFDGYVKSYYYEVMKRKAYFQTYLTHREIFNLTFKGKKRILKSLRLLAVESIGKFIKQKRGKQN